MLTYPSKLLKPLLVLLTASLAVGSLALIGLSIYLISAPVSGAGGPLPLVAPFSDSVNLVVPIVTRSLGTYILCSLLLVLSLVVAILFLYYLRRAVLSLSRKEGFARSLSDSVRNMGLLLLVFAYMRQIHLLVVFQQAPVEVHGLVQFTFRPLPSEVVYALALLILAKVFTYGLQLQEEYEQTV
jgi:hypothetical protein